MNVANTSRLIVLWPGTIDQALKRCSGEILGWGGKSTSILLASSFRRIFRRCETSPFDDKHMESGGESGSRRVRLRTLTSCGRKREKLYRSTSRTG